MRRSTVRALPTVAVLTVLAIPSAAHAATTPCLLTEATRIQTTSINLDSDAAKERIDVFNFDAAGAPVTMFQVCDRTRRGDYVRSQRVTVSESPGDRESGLRDSWVGRLSRGKRVEIAVRDFITPSAGEVLSIYRQKTSTSRTFTLVQRIAGDATTLTRPKGEPAEVKVQLKANHSSDGQKHTERWTYNARGGTWACASDCGGR